MFYKFFFKEYFEQRKDPSKAWTRTELEILNVIKRNPIVLENFKRLIELKGDLYFGIRTNIFQLMKLLSIISDEHYHERIFSLLELDLTKKVAREQVDIVCSGRITADIKYDQIPAERWNDREFVELLGCLKPSDSKIHMKLAEILGQNSSLFKVAAQSMESIKLIGLDAQKKLIEHYRRGVDRWPKLQMLALITKLDADMDLTQKLLIEALGDRDFSHSDITGLIGEMEILPQNVALVAQMFERMAREGSRQNIIAVVAWFYDSNYGTPKHGMHKTYSLKRADEQRPIINILLNKERAYLHNYAAMILIQNRPLAKENFHVLKSALEREDPNSEFYKTILQVLGK